PPLHSFPTRRSSDLASVVLDPRPLLTEHGFLVVAMPGKDMQVDGHVQILGRRPELIVMLRVKRQVRMRRLPDDRSLKASFGTARSEEHTSELQSPCN